MNNLYKQLLALVAMAAAFASAVPVAQAATVTGNFNVTVNLTAACEIAVAPTDVAFTYTSFQVAAATANSTFDVRCTNSLPYTMSLDATTGTVIGLNYSLSLAAGSNGTGAAQTHTISGTMAAGQSGICATSPPGTCAGTQARTLTITY